MLQNVLFGFKLNEVLCYSIIFSLLPHSFQFSFRICLAPDGEE